MSMRRIATYGEAVTFRSELTTTDTTTDWEAETTTETTKTVNAITREARSPQRDRSETGDDLDIDRYVYVYEGDLSEFTIYDYDGEGDTYVTISGAEYRVVRSEAYSTGTLRVEVVHA